MRSELAWMLRFDPPYLALLFTMFHNKLVTLISVTYGREAPCSCLMAAAERLAMCTLSVYAFGVYNLP